MRKVITIAREFGAGGGEIGRRVAKELGIEFYDKDIILRTALANSKLDPELEMYSVESGYMANVNLCTPTALSFGGLFQNEMDHSVDCVLNGTPCKSPAEDGATLMKTLDAIYESTRTGHEVVIQ